MTLPEMRADCGQCAALCCVGPAFDRSSRFALSKPNGTPCPNLGPDDACTIHAHLEARGFGGCVQFDCLGAGQHVVQNLFDGKSWRDGPALAPRMFETFRVMRQIFEALQLLQVAADLPLSASQRQELEQLQGRLWPDPAWSEAQVNAYEKSGLPEAVTAFLTSLRDSVQRPAD